MKLLPLLLLLRVDKGTSRDVRASQSRWAKEQRMAKHDYNALEISDGQTHTSQLLYCWR